MKKIIKKLFNEWWLDSLIIAISALVLFLVFIFPHLRDFISWFSDWVSLHEKYKIYPENFSKDLNLTEKQKAQELHNQFIRNFGWSVWVGISIIGLLVTFGLTIWGRKIQNKQWETQKDQWETQNKTQKTQHTSHLHERYEKAANMLGNAVMAVRVAGCQALTSLAIDDEKMKVQCVRLLFSFIRNPYIEEKDKDKDKEIIQNESIKIGEPNKYKELSKDEFLEKVFPIDEPLRDDIQEAADSFFTIYEYYEETALDDELIALSPYFWKNEKKNTIELAEANLEGMYFGDAYLLYAKLRGANLYNADLHGAELSGANLEYANLREAELSGAILEHANLQKADMHDVKMRDAILMKANLTKANLLQADLNSVILIDADLINANLSNAIFSDADLTGANFTDANLRNSIFTGADMSDIILKDADITFANMQEVENLTKEQVLSAIWGYGTNGRGSPPKLSEELVNDPDVKEWLAKPHFDKSKEKVSF